MERRHFLTTGTAVGLSLLAGCSSDQPSGPESTPSDSPTPTPEPSPTAEPTPTDCDPEVVSEDIEGDTTWDAADCPRIALDGNVLVTGGATLTIEPGVEVVGQAGSRLTVRDDGALVASGDPENPVWFHGESEEPGYWEGIWIHSDDPNNRFDNVTIQHGGAEGYANIYLEGTAGNGRASVTNTLSEQSATAGLIAEGGATLSEFASNEFRENVGAAVYIPTSLAGSIDADSTYVGDNGTDAVAVSSQDVQDDATWPGVPYRFDGENHRFTDGAVTVEPGARFIFGEGARITVKSGSSFTAEGTSDSPITFEGATAAPGSWEGIWIHSNDSNNGFDYVDIAHGGAEGYANIYLEGTAGKGKASVTNSTLRQSATDGLVVEGGATLSEFATNEFRENVGAAVYIPTSLAGSIDADSTYVGDNGIDAVRVSSQDVEEDATWPGVPYRLDGENHSLTGGAVTVEPGARFILGEGARLTVRSGSSFTAEGTSDSPITFEGATAEPGHWQGIWIHSNDSNNSFDNVDIAHGGAKEYANIYLEGTAGNGRASVHNSILRQSATWGIYVEEGATLDASSNTFEDNAEGGIRRPET